MRDATPPGPDIVLLADDDREIVFAAGIRLRAAGYRTVSAHDGNAAVAAAISVHPAAIVIDVRMPHKDGLAALAELKRRTDTRDIPVVVLSASIIDEQRALDAGARYFLKKPHRGEMLVKAVSLAISDCRAVVNPHQGASHETALSRPPSDDGQPHAYHPVH